jgi:hypothetical protein
MDHDSVGALAIILIFGFPVAAWIVSRVLAHNEYMAMLRMGIVPPPDSKYARRAMRQGWAPPPPGAAYGVTPPPTAAPNSYDPYAYAAYGAQRQLNKGIQVSMIGMALLIGLSFIGTLSGHMLGPWLLGGLIPLFVGIAQIISAVLAGAQFGLPGQTQQMPNSAFGPSPSAGAPPPQPPPTGDVYGWRPGPTPEIQKPAQPPDPRV